MHGRGERGRGQGRRGVVEGLETVRNVAYSRSLVKLSPLSVFFIVH